MTRVITFVLLAGALCAPSVLPSSAYADGGQAGPGADPQALEDTHFFPDFELGPIMVSGWNFKTLQEAVDAIGSDSEVKGRTAVLIDNVEESITVPAGKELSIDLYAHRLSGTAGKPAITVKSGAKLTIEGSVADSAVLFCPDPRHSCTRDRTRSVCRAKERAGKRRGRRYDPRCPKQRRNVRRA